MAAAPPPDSETQADVPELAEIARLAAAAGAAASLRQLCEVRVARRRLPVWAVTLGNPSPDVPAIGFVGGVHGLERIGAEVVIAHLRSVVARLAWDDSLRQQLRALRLLFVPLVNPGGLLLRTRANPNGVDLMRNAPVDAAEPVPWLVGGQRISAALPWYRGPAGAPLQPESQALHDVVCEELLTHRFSIAIDCHSGFGNHDRLWFPFAHTARPIAHLPEVHALAALHDDSHPQHRYLVEPQSRQYLAHGDLWDQLYLRACEQSERILLPLTLEMGSWIWVRKNPRQLFSRHGIFNPLIEHRRQRVLRRHGQLLDFLQRAAASAANWLPIGAARERDRTQALARWYGAGRAR